MRNELRAVTFAEETGSGSNGLSIAADWLGNSMSVRERKSREDGIVRWRIYARYRRAVSGCSDPEVIIDAPYGGNSARPVVVMNAECEAVAVWTQYLPRRHAYRTLVNRFHPVRGWGLARCAETLAYEEVLRDELVSEISARR